VNLCIAEEQWFSQDEVEFVVGGRSHLNEIANKCCVMAMVENPIVKEGVITCRSDYLNVM
jgi:hypothetical protein